MTRAYHLGEYWLLTGQHRVYHVAAAIFENDPDLVHKWLHILFGHCGCKSERVI